MLDNKRNSIANYDSYQNENQFNNRFESPIHINIKNRENYFVLSPTHKHLNRIEDANLSRILSHQQRKNQNFEVVTPSHRIARKMDHPLKKLKESTPQPLQYSLKYDQNRTFNIERAFKSPVFSLHESHMDDYESRGYRNLLLDYDKVLNELQIRDKELFDYKNEHDISRYHHLGSLRKELASMKENYDKKMEEVLEYKIQNKGLLDEIIILKKSHNQSYSEANVDDIKYNMNELCGHLEQKNKEIYELKNSFNEMKLNHGYEIKEFEATVFILNQEIKHKENEIRIKDIEMHTLLNKQNENGHQYKDTINKDINATPKKHSILYKKEKRGQSIEKNEKLKQMNNELELTITTFKNNLVKMNPQENNILNARKDSLHISNSSNEKLKNLEQLIVDKTSILNTENEQSSSKSPIQMLNEQQEIEDYKKNTLTLENENREMKERINILNSNCLKLQNDLKELLLSSEETKKAHDQLKTIQEEQIKIKLERDAYRSLSINAKNFIQEKEKYQKEIEELRIENTSLAKSESQVNEHDANYVRTLTLNDLNEIRNQKNMIEKMKEEIVKLEKINKNLLEELQQKKLKIANLEESIIELTSQANEALNTAKNEIDQFKAYHLALEQEYNDMNKELETSTKNYQIEKMKFQQQLRIYEDQENHIMKFKMESDNKQKEIEILKSKLESFNSLIEIEKGKLCSQNPIAKVRFSFGNNIMSADPIIKKEENDLMKKLKSLNHELDEIDKQVTENNKKMMIKFDSL